MWHMSREGKASIVLVREVPEPARAAIGQWLWLHWMWLWMSYTGCGLFNEATDGDAEMALFSEDGPRWNVNVGLYS